MKKIKIIDNKFMLYSDDILLSELFFELKKEYVGIFKLKTYENYRNMGYAEFLLTEFFYFIKNYIKINEILLNCYKNNEIALKLYLKLNFKIKKEYDDYYLLNKYLFF
jgi:ribosomal protein S18 acetylase RimI-like enzyme